MSQCTTSAILATEGEAEMRIVSNTAPSMLCLARHSLPGLSRQVRSRLKWFDYYQRHGGNASLTGRYSGISRERVYNTVRPHHQALGYLTPEQFLDQWHKQHQGKEALSRR